MSDITAVARVLLRAQANERLSLCEKIFAEAETADRYTRRMGRVHPVWGNGTLLAAARARPLAPEPTFDDPAYCGAICVVFTMLNVRSEPGIM